MKGWMVGQRSLLLKAADCRGVTCRVYGATVTIAKYLQRFSGPGVIVASAETVRYALARIGNHGS